MSSCWPRSPGNVRRSKRSAAGQCCSTSAQRGSEDGAAAAVSSPPPPPPGGTHQARARAGAPPGHTGLPASTALRDSLLLFARSCSERSSCMSADFWTPHGQVEEVTAAKPPAAAAEVDGLRFRLHVGPLALEASLEDEHLPPSAAKLRLADVQAVEAIDIGQVPAGLIDRVLRRVANQVNRPTLDQLPQRLGRLVGSTLGWADLRGIDADQANGDLAAVGKLRLDRVAIDNPDHGRW